MVSAINTVQSSHVVGTDEPSKIKHGHEHKAKIAAYMAMMQETFLQGILGQMRQMQHVMQNQNQ